MLQRQSAWNVSWPLPPFNLRPHFIIFYHGLWCWESNRKLKVEANICGTWWAHHVQFLFSLLRLFSPLRQPHIRHVGPQSASLFLLLQNFALIPHSVRHPRNKDPSSWGVQTITVPHTSNIPLKLWDKTVLLSAGSSLPETDHSADSERCLQTHVCSKPACVIEAGGAEKQKSDRVIKMTIKWQKPSRFLLLFIFTLGALMLSQGAFWSRCASLFSAPSHASLSRWNFVERTRNEIVSHCFCLHTTTFLSLLVSACLCLEPRRVELNTPKKVKRRKCLEKQ